MTKEEILAMKPGQELNAKVAECVMGYEIVRDATFGYMERSIIDGASVWGLPEPYSEDMSAAELVVEKMIEIGYGDAICLDDFADGRCTEAEAICKAALLAVLERGQIPTQERRRIAEVSDDILQQALGDRGLPPDADEGCPPNCCCPP